MELFKLLFQFGAYIISGLIFVWKVGYDTRKTIDGLKEDFKAELVKQGKEFDDRLKEYVRKDLCTERHSYVAEAITVQSERFKDIDKKLDYNRELLERKIDDLKSVLLKGLPCSEEKCS